MMLQRNPKVLTDDRELCRPQFPHVACHADRAAKLVLGLTDACTLAARAQHPQIERCVVSDQEVRPVQKEAQFWPKFAEGWTVTDVVPGQTVNICEDEFLSRWPDEPMVPFYNAIVLDMHDTD